MSLKLDLRTLLYAYAQGYFPMPHPETQEIQWYYPDPRAVIPLDHFHASRSLRRAIRQGGYRISTDHAFAAVMEGCADRSDTWINAEFKRAYGALHARGVGHSLEVWQDTQMVGGVYGLALGGAFFAESMFHRVTNASKIALFHLVQCLRQGGFTLLEVQFLTPHLASLGAREVPAADYMDQLRLALQVNAHFPQISPPEFPSPNPDSAL